MPGSSGRGDYSGDQEAIGRSVGPESVSRWSEWTEFATRENCRGDTECSVAANGDRGSHAGCRRGELAACSSAPHTALLCLLGDGLRREPVRADWAGPRGQPSPPEPADLAE